MEEKRTELSALGEFGLIAHLTDTLPLIKNTTVKGAGDDAAIIEPPAGEQMVITTDLLLEGVHFDLMYVPLVHLGYKAVVVNLSDVYAMNAQPHQITVSIAMSNRFSVEAIDEIYTGIRKACEYYKVDLVGGDTSSAVNGLLISVTAIGFSKPEKLVTRSGAREGDLLCVSGDLGGAFMGLQVLEREKKVFKEAPGAQPDLSGYDYILERQLKPEARRDIIGLLEKLEVQPTAMIDISDGLASEILHLAKQSFVGCDLYEEKIPIDPQTIQAAKEFNIDHTTAALNGGEDYELLFTIKQSDYEKVKGNPSLSIIGHITEEHNGCRLITKGGGTVELKAQGWNAFTS
ncbi:MAG: thiamine-phosphate kinase [Bacteroidota bacterium]|jgi:thiamine-monophosphate kinase